MKALARHVFNSAGIHTTAGKYGFIVCGKVLADDCDDTNIGEETRSQREVSRGSAQAAVQLSARCFDTVKCHTANYQDCHAHSILQISFGLKEA